MESTENRIQKITDMIIDSMTLLDAQDREEMISDLLKVIASYMPKMQKTVENTEYPDGLLYVSARVHHCEDAEINGKPDINDEHMAECAPSRMPGMICKAGEYYWEPVIDIATGRIINWEKHTTASTSYKVVDECALKYKSPNGTMIDLGEDYVPEFLSPDEDGYDDYMYMSIDGKGYIANWNDNKARAYIKSNI